MKESDASAPVYHLRFVECNINNQPAIVITSVQRYTDEYMRHVTKPGGDNYDTLERSDRERYKQYNAETGKIHLLEEKIHASFPEICYATALAYARAKTTPLVLGIPYEKQLEVQRHRMANDDITIPDIYDKIPPKFGFEPDAGMNNYWVLKAPTDSTSVMIPLSIYNQLSISLIGIAQRAYMSFNNVLYRNKQPGVTP